MTYLMWTVVRFELRWHEHYRAAFALLARAGFLPHRRPDPETTAALPAAAVRKVLQDPAVVSRAIFEALEEAGLAPVGVAAAHVDVAGAPRRRAALAQG